MTMERTEMTSILFSNAFFCPEERSGGAEFTNRADYHFGHRSALPSISCFVVSKRHPTGCRAA